MIIYPYVDEYGDLNPNHMYIVDFSYVSGPRSVMKLVPQIWIQVHTLLLYSLANAGR